MIPAFRFEMQVFFYAHHFSLYLFIRCSFFTIRIIFLSPRINMAVGNFIDFLSWCAILCSGSYSVLRYIPPFSHIGHCMVYSCTFIIQRNCNISNLNQKFHRNLFLLDRQNYHKNDFLVQSQGLLQPIFL